MKKYRSFILISTLILFFILAFTPIFINVLMFIPTVNVKGDSNTWITSLSTFWGAVIGGILSGALTLIGVVITLKSSFKSLEINKKNDFLKQRLLELYQPCYSMQIRFSYMYGAHHFSDLMDIEKEKMIFLLQDNQLFASSKLRIKTIELGWSFKAVQQEQTEENINAMNTIYNEIDDIVSEEFRELLNQLGIMEEWYENETTNKE